MGQAVAAHLGKGQPPQRAPHALRYGEGLARALDAVLIPVIAWELPGGNRVGPSGDLRQACRDLACQRLREALMAVWGDVPDDPRVRPHVERGPAAWVLVNLASRPDDVLVVGAGRLRAQACNRTRHYRSRARPARTRTLRHSQNSMSSGRWGGACGLWCISIWHAVRPEPQVSLRLRLVWQEN